MENNEELNVTEVTETAEVVEETKEETAIRMDRNSCSN